MPSYVRTAQNSWTRDFSKKNKESKAAVETSFFGCYFSHYRGKVYLYRSLIDNVVQKVKVVDNCNDVAFISPYKLRMPIFWRYRVSYFIIPYHTSRYSSAYKLFSTQSLPCSPLLESHRIPDSQSDLESLRISRKACLGVIATQGIEHGTVLRVLWRHDAEGRNQS